LRVLTKTQTLNVVYSPAINSPELFSGAYFRGIEMLHKKSVLIGVVASLTLSATPSFAGNIIAELAFRVIARSIADTMAANGYGAPSDPRPLARVWTPSQDYTSASWYRNWIAQRENPGVLAFRRCTMSDGQREIVTPCQLVAQASSGAPLPDSATGALAK
jgi:hypothetical protein